MSGRHELGFVVPGGSLHVSKRHVMAGGYKMPTQTANGKSGLVLEYGIAF
jgi:hypothetical protein